MSAAAPARARRPGRAPAARLLGAGAAPLALAAGWAFTLAATPWGDESISDLYVYRSYAALFLDGVVPYRDVGFEYPPLAAPALALPGLAGTGGAAYRLAFAALTLAFALWLMHATAALARRTGGEPRRALWALAALPLLAGALVRTRYDVLAVAVAVAALAALAARPPRRERAAAAGLGLLAAGTALKAFPLLAAPVALAWLAGRGERRAALAGAGALAAVLAATGSAWLAISPAGAVDAVAYHLERPVQVESVAGVALRGLEALGAGDAVPVSSHRSDGLEHPAAGAAAALCGAALCALLAWLCIAAARRPDPRALALAALAAMTAFAALGKVLSPQFLIWAAPLGALALAWRMHALAALVAAALALTLAEFPSRYFDVVEGDPGALALVALRNACLLGALWLAARALAAEPERAGAPGAVPEPRAAARAPAA